MEINIRDINKVMKEFFSESYDFFRRKYMRQHAMDQIEDFEDFPESVLKESLALFVLSTGRCGTDFLNHLLKQIDDMDVHHEAHPKLAVTSRYLYENNIAHRGGEVAFIGARYHALQDAYLFDKMYVETNNRLTFFAPYIESLMPHARFVHLVRHPGDFVRSGMRRGYYGNSKIVDYSKLRPTKDNPYNEKWDTFTRIEKISWLWYETNAFIEDFKEKHPDKVLTVKSELLFEDPEEATRKILMHVNLSYREDLKVELGPKNKQKTGQFPRYQNWSQENKDKMKAIVGELAAKYDYRL